MILSLNMIIFQKNFARNDRLYSSLNRNHIISNTMIDLILSLNMFQKNFARNERLYSFLNKNHTVSNAMIDLILWIINFNNIPNKYFAIFTFSFFLSTSKFSKLKSSCYDSPKSRVLKLISRNNPNFAKLIAPKRKRETPVHSLSSSFATSLANPNEKFNVESRPPRTNTSNSI